MALIPTEISSSLSSLSGLGGDAGEVFTNVSDVVQTVESVWGQVSGQSQAVPGQTAEVTPTSPMVEAAATTDVKPVVASDKTMLLIGGVVLVTALILIMGD